MLMLEKSQHQAQRFVMHGSRKRLVELTLLFMLD